MNKILLPIVLFIISMSGSALAQTGNYSQTLPNMQSVYQATPVVFTNTPGNASSGTLSCSWLGCQDVGMSNPSINVQIYLNGNYQTLVQTYGASFCGFVNFSYTIPAVTLNNAIQSGNGSVMLRVYVQDPCPAGMGCSCCNDPYINSLNLTYSYSQASFTVSDSSICPGESIQFTNTTPGTLTSRKWYFTGGSPATSTGNNPTVTYTTPGTYPVALVTTSVSGTDSTIKNAYITVNNPPQATTTAGGNTTFCSGGSVVLSANTGAGQTYQWKKNTANISGATAANYTAKTTGTYYVTITNSFGCTNTSSGLAVTVNPKPTAILSAGGATTVCPGDSVVLTASQASGYTYTWKKNLTTIAGATISTYAAKASADYKVVVTNGFGCSKTSNIIPVVVNTPKATVTVQGSSSVCNGNGVILKANTGAGLSYQWKIGSTNINGATDSMYVAYTSGSYKVKVTNSCGTSTSAASVVTINPLPVVNIAANGPTTFCSGGSVTFITSGDPGLTYVWKRNGVDIAGATGSSYMTGTSGTYSVVATNSFGCTSTSNSIAVTANNTSANVTAGGPTTFCNGDSVVLIANTGANLSYQWTRNNVTLTGATSSSYVAKTTGAYRVNITNTATGCAKTSSAVQVTVNCKIGDSVALNGPEVQVNPNPFHQSTQLNISLPDNETGLMEISSIDGKIISVMQLNGGTHKMNIGENLEEGVYFIRVRVAGMERVERIVKY